MNGADFYHSSSNIHENSGQIIWSSHGHNTVPKPSVVPSPSLLAFACNAEMMGEVACGQGYINGKI